MMKVCKIKWVSTSRNKSHMEAKCQCFVYTVENSATNYGNFHIFRIINPLTNDKIWDQSSLKAFVDDILNVIQVMICVADWVKNIVGKALNAGYHHFLLFPQCFQNASFPDSLKVGIVW